VSEQPPFGQPYGQIQSPPPPPPPPAYGFPPPQKTNTMAILGLVFAFVFSPLGIVFSAIGLSQVKQRRENGRGIALAGLIVSIVFTLFWILVVIGALVARTTDVGTSATETAQSSIPALGADPSSDDTTTDPGTGAGTGSGSAGGGDVSDACQVILPALMKLESDMANVSSVDDYTQALDQLEATLKSATAGVDDAQFVQDVDQLSADLAKAATAVQNGQDPSSLENALVADGEAVGTACGGAGFN
jgi:Domain of unknown function (DUF4190)